MIIIRLLRLFTPTAVFFAYLLWTVMAMASSLRMDAVVTGEQITLGDVFGDAGPVASRVVMPAPAAGRSVVLDTVTLARLARANGIAWQPTSGIEYVKIERASQRFDAALLGDAIMRNLPVQPATGIGQTSVQLDNPQLVLHAPLDVPAELTFSSLSLDNTGQRFSGLAQLRSGERILAQTAVAGRIVTRVDVPVLTRPIRRDEVISSADITWTPTDLTAGTMNVLFNAADLIGKAPRTSLRPGVPVRAAELVSPPAVNRGKMVTMIYQAGRLTITAQGRALSDAAVGDIVRVVNVNSSRTVEGVVEALGVVRIGASPAGRETAANITAPANIRAN